MLRSGSIRPDRPDLFAIFRRCRHFGRRVDRPRSIPPYLCACCPARYPRSRPPDLARRPQSQTLSPAPAQLRTPFPEPQSRPPGPQLPDAACPPFGPPPKRTLPENTDAAPSRNLRTPPAPIRLPKRTPPENTEAAPIRSPLQKNAIIPAGTSSGRDDPHSERRRTASRDDGMSAVGPPSGETALLPRQPSAPLRIPPSQAGRPLRLQKRSH